MVDKGGPSDVPNAARMYDWYLGGAQNFASDRECAQQALTRFPHTARSAQANRSFLRRAVRWCVRAGIDQFLDLGSGIPTVGNVHEVARVLDPAARVVYVDHEPVAAAHARGLLRDTDGVAVAQVDLRDPAAVFDSSAVRDTLDLTRPVAVLLVAVLHFVADTDDPARDRRDLCRRGRGRQRPGAIARQRRPAHRGRGRPASRGRRGLPAHHDPGLPARS